MLNNHIVPDAAICYHINCLFPMEDEQRLRTRDVCVIFCIRCRFASVRVRVVCMSTLKRPRVALCGGKEFLSSSIEKTLDGGHVASKQASKKKSIYNYLHLLYSSPNLIYSTLSYLLLSLLSNTIQRRRRIYVRLSMTTKQKYIYIIYENPYFFLTRLRKSKQEKNVTMRKKMRKNTLG